MLRLTSKNGVFPVKKYRGNSKGMTDNIDEVWVKQNQSGIANVYSVYLYTFEAKIHTRA